MGSNWSINTDWMLRTRVTCDAGSPNRRLFQLHKMPDTPNSKIVHKAKNVFKSNPDEPMDILFFTDPPHLLKTIRNCFENPSRKLWVSIW